MQRQSISPLKPRRLQVNQTLRRIFMQKKLHQLFFPLANPENPAALAREAGDCECLGETRDGCHILLLDGHGDSLLLREIGRLRELTFRRVGEGTGRRRDLDSFDSLYHHLLLWDEQSQRIAGAYRLGQGKRLLAGSGLKGFYTASLYDYDESIRPFLSAGLELGRSFVHPDYQGKASLDYLWQGIGAYLGRYPHIRYLLGPVSISSRYPPGLVTELVLHYQRWYGVNEQAARARTPWKADAITRTRTEQLYSHLDQEASFTLLDSRFAEKHLRIPVLLRQYASLFEPGGFKVLETSVDHAFGDCVDLLCMADLNRLKARKRKRYIPEPEFENVPPCLSLQTVPASPLENHPHSRRHTLKDPSILT